MSGKITYRPDILGVFVLLEVLLYNTNVLLQGTVAVAEYLFLFLVFVKDRQVGILYFLSFTLLTLGWGNYFGREIAANGFWGIRVGSFSLNILFSLVFCLGILIQRKGKLCILWNRVHLFFILFIFYSIVMGSINTLSGRNYVDNFGEDLMTYFSYFIYIVILAEISNDLLLVLLKYVIALTVVTLLLSFGLNQKSIYADGYFLLSNAIYFILPVAVFVFKELYSRWIWIIMLVIVYGFMMMGEYFIAGKTVILLLFLFGWISWKLKSLRYLLVLPLILFALNMKDVLDWCAGFFDGSIIAYKFGQISEALSYVNLDAIASLPSSIGNLLAEGMTIVGATMQHWVCYVFGGGFGAAVPDIYGYLHPWSYMGGYREIDAVRNAFHKMHLPVFEIFLKGGCFFLVYYLLIMIDTLRSKNVYAFVFGLMFFFTFYVSKEALLLTLILLKIGSTPILGKPLPDTACLVHS